MTRNRTRLVQNRPRDSHRVPNVPVREALAPLRRRPLPVHPLPTAPKAVRTNQLKAYWKEHLPARPKNNYLVRVSEFIQKSFVREEYHLLVGYTFIWGTHRHADPNIVHGRTLRYAYHGRLVAVGPHKPKQQGDIQQWGPFWIELFYSVTTHELNDPLPPAFRNLACRPCKRFPNWRDRNIFIRDRFEQRVHIDLVDQLKEIEDLEGTETSVDLTIHSPTFL